MLLENGKASTNSHEHLGAFSASPLSSLRVLRVFPRASEATNPSDLLCELPYAYEESCGSHAEDGQRSPKSASSRRPCCSSSPRRCSSGMGRATASLTPCLTVRCTDTGSRL